MSYMRSFLETSLLSGKITHDTMRVLLDNWEEIHYIRNSYSDMHFVNCRKDQIVCEPCSGSAPTRRCAFYRHKTRTVTPSVQEGTLHVLLLFAAHPCSSILFFSRITPIFFEKYRKVSYSPLLIAIKKLDQTRTAFLCKWKQRSSLTRAVPVFFVIPSLYKLMNAYPIERALL